MEQGVEGVGTGASILLVAVFDGVATVCKADCGRLVLHAVKGYMGKDKVLVGFRGHHGGFEGPFADVGYDPSPVFGATKRMEVLDIRWRSICKRWFLYEEDVGFGFGQSLKE